jgi:hypothetical protein
MASHSQRIVSKRSEYDAEKAKEKVLGRIVGRLSVAQKALSLLSPKAQFDEFMSTMEATMRLSRIPIHVSKLVQKNT